jgi:hypothetical protein
MSLTASLPQPWSYKYRTGPTLANDGTLWTASIVYITTQANLVAFIGVVAGLPPTVISTSYGTMTRVIPLQHPLYPWCYAKRVRTEAFGTPSPSSTALQDLHSHMWVTVEFESYPFGTTGDQAFMQFDSGGGSKYVTIPGRKMKFPSGEVIGQEAGVMVVETAYNLTLFQCPTLNDSVIQPLTGKINNAPFMGKPTGQMRFDTWESSQEVAVGGVVQFKKSLKFTYQDHHWNQFFKADGTLDTPTDPASNPAYQLTDFSVLLKS